jgi:hypothetical protein
MFKNNTVLREAMIIYTATQAHGKWRTDYRAQNGDTPRIKTTTDQAWIAGNGTDQVDIAARDFSQLPSDWQKENRLGAEVAVDLVLVGADADRIFNDAFIEEASDPVHAGWLERNGAYASDVQKLPYGELPEEEKEKDRFFVRAAISSFNICRVAKAA